MRTPSGPLFTTTSPSFARRSRRFWAPDSSTAISRNRRSHKLDATIRGFELLNQAVTRNEARFPPDFAFILMPEEHAGLRSQIVTSNGRGGRRYLPRAFTVFAAIRQLMDSARDANRPRPRIGFVPTER